MIPVLVDEASMPRAEQLPEDLRRLCDHQARKIGDTQGRRKADLDVLIRDIEAVGGIQSRPRSDPQNQPPSTSQDQSWFKVDRATVGIALSLALCAAVYAYLSNVPLGSGETFFLLLCFSVLVARSGCGTSF